MLLTTSHPRISTKTPRPQDSSELAHEAESFPWCNVGDMLKPYIWEMFEDPTCSKALSIQVKVQRGHSHGGLPIHRLQT